MSAPERSSEPQEPQRSSEHDMPKPGGFGEFFAVYRARWAMDHPNMRRRWPVTTDSQSPVMPAGAPALEHDPMPARPAAIRQGDTPNVRERP